MNHRPDTRFRTARIAAGLSQCVLAKRVGKSFQAIQFHDANGIRNYGCAELYAPHLGVRPEQLMEPSRPAQEARP